MNGETRRTASNVSISKMVMRLGLIVASANPRTELAKLIEELRNEMGMPQITPIDATKEDLERAWLETASRYLEAV